MSNKWTFESSNLVPKFDKHIKSSVLGYREYKELIISYMDFFIKKESVVYDLGCSTGAFLDEINLVYSDLNLNCIGIDSAQEMIDFANEHFKKENVNFFMQNIDENFDFEIPGDVYIVYLLLCFMTKKQRMDLLKKIYDNMERESALFIYDKIKSNNPQVEDMYNQLLIDFKIKNGHTLEEIIKKQLSLRGIMKPLIEDEFFKMLTELGFKTEVIYKNNNFVGVLCLK